MPDPQRQPVLSRSTIVEAALTLLDAVGLDGLSVRRLAAELDVQNPTLYWHFRNKQELLNGMADAIVRAAGMGPPRKGEAWQHWLRRRGRAYRDSLLAHRDGARVVAGASSLSDQTLQDFERELTALIDRGFSPGLALRTINAVTVYTEGFVLREQRQAAHPDGEAGANDVPGRVQLPVLTEALRDSEQAGREDVFEYGLRALVNGAADVLGHPPRRPRPRRKN